MTEKNKNHPTLKSYLTGFILSIILTLIAFAIVNIHMLGAHNLIPHEALITLLIILAFVQLVVQLIFFLHLASEKPRWNLAFFVLFFSLILILVIGALWIMGHLDYNMKPEEMSHYLMLDEGIKR